MKGPTTWGVWGHAPPENFEILVFWNAISSLLRGQILSKMFSKSIVLFMLIFIAWLRVEVVNFILYKLCGFWNCSGYHFQLSILCVVPLLYEYHKNSFENFKTTVEIWNSKKSEIFLSRTHIDRDFGIFEQNRKDPTRSRWLKSLYRHTCFFLTYFLRTSFKFSSRQSVECALKAC